MSGAIISPQPLKLYKRFIGTTSPFTIKHIALHALIMPVPFRFIPRLKEYKTSQRIWCFHMDMNWYEWPDYKTDVYRTQCIYADDATIAFDGISQQQH